MTRGWISWPTRLLARPFRADELPVVRASLEELRSYYRAHGEDAARLIAVGESKADPALDPSRTGRLDDAGQRVDEPG